jgi:hypothetical protein
MCHECLVGKVDQAFHDERGTGTEHNREKLKSMQGKERDTYLEKSGKPKLPKEGLIEG